MGKRKINSIFNLLHLDTLTSGSFVYSFAHTVFFTIYFIFSHLAKLANGSGGPDTVLPINGFQEIPSAY